MLDLIKYAIFPTKWGFFALAGTQLGLCRTHLPGRTHNSVKARILSEFPGAKLDQALFKPLQQRIIAYFAGANVDFAPDIPVDLTGLTRFQAAVLTACRAVPSGQTTNYAALAKKIGNPAAARAVGNALARNPLPLIIPCHRILRTNQTLGGFSAPGGTHLKARLLRLEQAPATNTTRT